MSFRVVSYNIRLGLEEGLDAVASVLDPLGADLIALQEVGDHWTMGEAIDQTGYLADALKMDHRHHVVTIREQGTCCYGHALLSRTPLRDVESHLLPQLRDEPRRVLVGRLELSAGDVIVMSTHLTHLDPERPVQLEALGALLAGYEAAPRVLLFGDLNETRPELLSPLIEGAGLTDHGAQESQPTYPSRAPTDRRDVILTRGFEETSRLRVLETLASDHRPIVVDVAPTRG